MHIHLKYGGPITIEREGFKAITFEAAPGTIFKVKEILPHDNNMCDLDLGDGYCIPLINRVAFVVT
jgi:hypothetical protein